MDFSFTREKDLGRPATVSSDRFFASINLDGSFGENCGFWLPPLKVLDKFGFVSNDTKLKSNKAVIKPSRIELSGSVEDCTWRQLIYCPVQEAASIVEFESDFNSVNINLDTSFEIATSPIRTEEGVKGREKGKDYFILKNEDENLFACVVSSKEIELVNNKEMKVPGDVKFSISGSLKSKKEALETARKTLENSSEISQEKEDHFRNLMEKRTFLETPDEEINEYFSWAKAAVEKLYHQNDFGSGYFAGLPEFPNFFGRDTIWSIKGINGMGCFEKVKDSLATLGKVQSQEKGRCKLEGEIPHEFGPEGSEVHYNSSDGTLLWVIGCYDYINWSGDFEFLEQNYEDLKKAIEWGFEKDENDDLLVENWMELFSESPFFLVDTSWMDTKIRWKAAVDIQGIWFRALKCGQKMGELMEDYDFSEMCKKTSEKVKSKINDLYWNEDSDYYYDKKGLLKMGGSTTSNPIILALFDVAESNQKDKIFDKISSEEFTTDWGVRSVSKDDFLYIPGGLGFLSYHRGKVWPLITGWCTTSEFLNHRPNIAKKHLDSFKLLTEVFSPGVLPETVNGNELVSEDCFHQAWSSAMFVYSVVSGMLGIRPRMLKDKIMISPHIPEDWDFVRLKRLAVGENLIDLNFSRNGDDWECKLRSDDLVSVELSMPVEDSEVFVDGEKVPHENEMEMGCGHTSVSFDLKGKQKVEFRNS